MVPVIRIRRQVVARTLWISTAVVLGLGVFQIVFVAVFGAETFFGRLQRIALDSELCLPAWYSSMLMMVAAILSGLCGLDARQRDPRNARAWIALSFIFVYLSLDEMTGLHELLVPIMHNALRPTGFFLFAWVIVAIPLVIFVGAMFLPFLFRLPGPIGRRIAVAGFVFVAGALGMEMVGGKLFSVYGRTPIYYAGAFVEEALEMIGIVLLILAVLDHLGRSGRVALDLDR